MVRSLKFTSNAQTFLTRLMIQQLLKKGLGPLSYLYIHLVQSHHFTVTKYLFTDYLVCGISMCLSLKYNFCIFKNTGTCKLGFYPLPWLNKVTAIQLGEMNVKRKSDTVCNCLSLLKGWIVFLFFTHVLPLISMDNWEYIAFYSY